MSSEQENITVILPIRNGQNYIKKVMPCVISNVTKNDEILLINDGSTDDTKSQILDWSARDPRIRILDSGGIGLVNSLNLGLREASNNWIARFDVDDLYPNERLMKQRIKIANDCAAIFCDYSFFSSKIKDIGSIPCAINQHAVSVSLIKSQRTPHPGVLYNKTAVLDVGGYREIDFPAEDLSLWLRLSKVGNITGVGDTLLNYRLSSESITGSRRQEALLKKSKLINEIGLNLQDLKWCLDNWESLFLSYNNYSLSTERKILAYHEMKLACEIYSMKTHKLSEIKYYFLKNHEVISAFTNLAKLKLKKKIASQLS